MRLPANRLTCLRIKRPYKHILGVRINLFYLSVKTYLPAASGPRACLSRVRASRPRTAVRDRENPGPGFCTDGRAEGRTRDRQAPTERPAEGEEEERKTDRKAEGEVWTEKQTEGEEDGRGRRGEGEADRRTDAPY